MRDDQPVQSFVVETLAEVLAAGRARTPLSQEQVGDLIDRTGSAVGKWERGESIPSALDLGLLAAVLPLERSADELRALRRDALRERQKVAPEPDGPGTEREVVWLKTVYRGLSDRLDQLDEIVDFLESESPG